MMRRKLLTIFNSALAPFAALLLATMLAPSVHAQAAQRQTRDGRTATPSSTTTTPTAPTQTRDTQTPRAAEESGAEPDLSITAHVTADSLRFEKVPDPKVEFTGKPRRDTVWQSERENLPQQVQPGVTYRNIGITLRITSVFADIDRIVAEALGELPASDDAKPQGSSPTQPGAQSDARAPAASATQGSRPAQTPSPAKASTRANARGRAERRGRGR
jgi:hypothetical protein